jgi:hypothetical protein
MRALLSFHSDFSEEVEEEVSKWLDREERAELFYSVEGQFIWVSHFGDIPSCF